MQELARKVTFAALQTKFVTRMLQRPGGAPRAVRISVSVSWSGLNLTAVEQTAQASRRRNLLRSPHKHCSRALNRLCLSWQLQLMALSSVQLSSTHHTACAAVPWAFAINSVADAETIYSSLMCTYSLSRFFVLAAPFCNSIYQVVLLFGVAPPYCTCLAGECALAGDPQRQNSPYLVDHM